MCDTINSHVELNILASELCDAYIERKDLLSLVRPNVSI